MKRIALTTFQFCVTVLLLWWIFRDPDKNREMLQAILAAEWLWLLPGVGCVGMACLLQTQRWRLLLAAQGIRMGWWRTFRVYMVGMFFNLFLLGATGGDVVKIYYAMRETLARKGAALLSVLVDRMMGLLGLIVVTAVIIPLRWESLTAHALTQGLLGTLAMVMGAMAAMVVFGFVVDRFQLASRLPAWLPMHGKIIEFSNAFSVYARDGKTLGATLGISVLAHVFNFLAFYCAALGFGVFKGLTGLFDIASVMPVVMTITALPISLAGVGVREALFEQMLAVLFGTPEATSVMISMTGFFMTVFWGLVGGAIYLFYRPSGGLHLSEMRQDVEAVETSLETRQDP